MSTTLAPTDPRSLHYQRNSPATLASNIMDTIDSKAQGFIDKDELQTAVLKLTKTNLSGGITAEGAKKLDALFEKLDIDGDGKISALELEAAIKKMTAGRPPKAPDVKNSDPVSGLTTYEPADKNKDGTVSATELLVYELRQTAKAIAMSNAATPNDTVAATHKALAIRERAYSSPGQATQPTGFVVTDRA